MTAEFDPLFGALRGGSGWFPSPAHTLRRAAILGLVSGLEPGRLIDMGCGAGRWLVDWDRLGHHGTGVEPDPGARALAADCAAAFGAAFEVAEAPPDAPGGFDHLSAIEVLEHLEDPLGALVAWRALLRPGGTLIASVPAFRRLWGASDVWAGHVQRFEPEAFAALVGQAGFRVEVTRLYGYPLGNLTRLAGNLASRLKRRRRSGAENERLQATLASGRDRSVERRLAPLLRSWLARGVLRAGIAAQARFPSRGIGVIVVARAVPAGGPP